MEIDIALLKNEKYIICFSQSDYLTSASGVEKVILEQSNGYNERQISYIHIFPIALKYKMRHKWSFQELYGVNIDQCFSGTHTRSDLNKFFEQLQIEGRKLLELHIHHLLFFKNMNWIKRRIIQFHAKTKFFVHDYASICNSINLLRNGKKFCQIDQYGKQVCRGCIYRNSKRKKKKYYEDLFQTLGDDLECILPSQAAALIWKSVYCSDNLKITVEPHNVIGKIELKPQMSRGKKMRIAYVGRQAKIKGWEVWEKFCREDDDKYSKYILGSCEKVPVGCQYIYVNYLDKSQKSMIQVIKDMDIDIVILWSIVPETYSFTYFESSLAGAFVLTNIFSGNIAAMVRKNRNGKVFNEESELLNWLNNTGQVRTEIEMIKDIMKDEN